MPADTDFTSFRYMYIYIYGPTTDTSRQGKRQPLTSFMMYYYNGPHLTASVKWPRCPLPTHGVDGSVDCGVRQDTTPTDDNISEVSDNKSDACFLGR